MPLNTLEDVSRYAKSLCRCDVSIPLCAEWVNFRIAEVAGRRRLRFYRRFNELSTPAPYTTGTVSLTRGSKVVTGVGTSWIDATHRDWFLRTKTAWYRIESVNSPTQILLVSPFAEDTVTGVNYTLVKQYHELPLNVHTLGSDTFVHARTGKPLESISVEEARELYPGKFYQAGGIPNSVWEVEPHYTGARQIELYPYPGYSELFYYVCWLKPTALDILDPVPSFINPYVLVEGVKVDILLYEATRSEKVDMMATLLNEHRRQSTYWHAKMGEALIQERGIDDSQFLVKMLSDRRRHGDSRIITAYDAVWERP